MKCYSTESEILYEENARKYDKCGTSLGPKPKFWCHGKWDGLACWNHTPPDSFAFLQCPSHIGGSTYFRGESIASKFCTANGTWWINDVGNEWANYTQCVGDSYIQFQKIVAIMFIAGYCVSFAFLLVAFFIFAFFRNAKTLMHQHLILSSLLTCCTQITWNYLNFYPIVLMKNPIWCRVLHVLQTYSLVTNYMWMFCEGLFLHCVLEYTFVSEMKIFYSLSFLGWTAPVVPVALYTVLRQNCIRHHLQLQFCWIYVVPEFWWIYASFTIFLLLGVFVSLMVCFVNGEVRSLLRRRWSQWKQRRFDSQNLMTLNTTSTDIGLVTLSCPPSSSANLQT